MNVLICCHSWLEEISGVGSVIRNLGTYLQNKGNRVLLFYHDVPNIIQKTEKFGFEGYKLNLRPPIVSGCGLIKKVKSLGAFTFYFPSVIYQLCKFIKSNNIEVVNIHYVTNGFIYFAVCRKLLSKQFKLITSIHGSDIFPDGLAKPNNSYSLRYLLGSSDRIVTPSNSLLKDAAEVYPRLKDKGTFIHNGLQFEEFNIKKEDPPIESIPYILCVAFHFKEKGLDTLINAFKRVASVDGEIKLLLAGDGPLRTMLEGMVREYGLSERIIFLGVKSRVEVATLFYWCKIFVLPSRQESFGLVLLEAMISKKPIVTTSVGGIVEIIQDNVNGLLVPPDNIEALSNAILRLLSQPELQQRLSERGYEIALKHFSWEVMGERYEKIMYG